MFVKFLSAFLAAGTLSVTFTIVNNQNKSAETVIFYPPIYEFFVGSILLLAFFVFFGIPLSLVADLVVVRIAKRNGAKAVLKLFMYALFGAAIGVVFLLFKGDFEMKSAAYLLIYFGASGVVFAFYQWLMHFLRKLLLKSVR